MLDGLVLGIGRFPKIVPMPVADAPATRRAAPPSPTTFPSYTGLLVGLLVGALLILGGLDFFPALALCSVAGHTALRCGLFVGLLVGFVLIVGGVALAPAITVGPVTENLATPAALS